MYIMIYNGQIYTWTIFSYFLKLHFLEST